MSLRRLLYDLVLLSLLPFIPLRLWWRARTQPGYGCHWRERFGFYDAPTAQPLIWIHAVSVGETRAAAPLVEALLKHYPAHRILLTHMTPTGRETSEALFGPRVLRAYLPYDYPFAVKRFLGHFRPSLALFMETELWPNIIAACRAAGIPAWLINARLSPRSARRYRRVEGLSRPMFRSLTGVLAQTEADASRLRALGAERVTVTGNLKFDVTPPDTAQSSAAALRARFGGRPVLLAASTRAGEEELLLEALPHCSVPGMLLVIVPRHPQRFDAVAACLARRGLKFQRRRAMEEIHADTQVLLGDSMGELFAYYGAADVALIGGSLLPLGGQNPIEACVMGVPVLLGPHFFNFAQVAADAIAAGAALKGTDAVSLMRLAAALLQDPDRRARMGAAARAFALAHRGATARTLEALGEALRVCAATPSRPHPGSASH